MIKSARAGSPCCGTITLLGDCSIQIDTPRFTREEITACAERTGLLELELVLPTGAGSGELSADEIVQLLDDAKALGCRSVSLLERKSSALRDVAIKACFHRDLACELYNESGDFNGVPPDVAIALPMTSRAAIERLQAAGRAHIAVRIYASPTNIDDVPELFHWLRSRRVTPRVQVLTPGRSSGMIPPRRIVELFEQLAAIDRDAFNRTWPLDAKTTARSGGRHAYSCFIDATGTVYASEGIAIPLGNIRTEPLRQILNLSEVLENLRAANQKLKQPCHTCLQATGSYCSRETAYQLTGDYLAGDPWCWRAEGAAIPSLPVPARDMVPHGPSIRMVDALTEVAERLATTQFVVPRDSFLLDGDGRLDELACIEMIAQSFAVSHGFHPDAGESTMQRGLLIGVKDVVIAGDAFAGDRLKIKVRKTTRFGDFGVIDGEVHHADGRPVATGQIKVWRPTGEAAKALIP